MREWNYDKGYRIYYNLHKHCFSVQAWDVEKKGWRLYKHTKRVICLGVKFRVYESGRQKVIKEQKKNVHAFVLADAISTTFPECFQLNQETPKAYYNPYKCEQFTDMISGEHVHKAETALLTDKTIYYVD